MILCGGSWQKNEQPMDTQAPVGVVSKSVVSWLPPKGNDNCRRARSKGRKRSKRSNSSSGTEMKQRWVLWWSKSSGSAESADQLRTLEARVSSEHRWCLFCPSVALYHLKTAFQAVWCTSQWLLLNTSSAEMLSGHRQNWKEPFVEKKNPLTLTFNKLFHIKAIKISRLKQTLFFNTSEQFRYINGHNKLFLSFQIAIMIVWLKKKYKNDWCFKKSLTLKNYFSWKRRWCCVNLMLLILPG